MNNATNTRHSDDCKMAFGRPDKRGCCARCNELLAGAAPRAGWRTDPGKLNTAAKSGPTFSSADGSFRFRSKSTGQRW